MLNPKYGITSDLNYSECFVKASETSKRTAPFPVLLSDVCVIKEEAEADNDELVGLAFSLASHGKLVSSQSVVCRYLYSVASKEQRQRGILFASLGLTILADTYAPDTQKLGTKEFMAIRRSGACVIYTYH